MFQLIQQKNYYDVNIKSMTELSKNHAKTKLLALFGSFRPTFFIGCLNVAIVTCSNKFLFSRRNSLKAFKGCCLAFFLSRKQQNTPLTTQGCLQPRLCSQQQYKSLCTKMLFYPQKQAQLLLSCFNGELSLLLLWNGVPFLGPSFGWYSLVVVCADLVKSMSALQTNHGSQPTYCTIQKSRVVKWESELNIKLLVSMESFVLHIQYDPLMMQQKEARRKLPCVLPKKVAFLV